MSTTSYLQGCRVYYKLSTRLQGLLQAIYKATVLTTSYLHVYYKLSTRLQGLLQTIYKDTVLTTNYLHDYYKLST